MAEDGSVVIGVKLDTAKADKELAKMNQKIENLTAQIDKQTTAKNAIADKLKAATDEADETRAIIKDIQSEIARLQGIMSGAIEVDPSEFMKIPEQLERAKTELKVNEDLYKKQEQAVTKLEGEQAKVNQKIEEGTEALHKMQDQAGNLARSIETQRPFDNIAASIDDAKGKMMKFIKYAIGIRSVYALFRKLRSAIKDAVMAFAAQDKETQTTVNSLKASLEALKLSWGAAFAPILNAVAPLLQTLINWLTQAANAVARFIAIVSGRSTYKKAVANNNALSSSLKGVGSAAKEAKKQVMDFDDLNILQDTSSSGSGGGAAQAAQLVEETVDALDGSFLSNLALTVRDVFFDWQNWNAEMLLEKALAFIPAAAGAKIGWDLFGLKGAVLGGLLGLAFGLLLGANSFNHDGKLDANEIMQLAVNAIPALAGLITGILTGNPLIGFTVGLALTLILEPFKNGGTNIVGTIEEAMLAAFPMIAGLIVGTALGHPLLGLTLGLIISLAFKGFGKSENGETKESWVDKIRKALHFPSDKEIYDNFKKWIWDDGIKALFNDLVSFVTGGQLPEAKNTADAIAGELQDGLTTSTNTKLGDWWNNTIKPFFSSQNWSDMGKEAGDSLSGGLKKTKLPVFQVAFDFVRGIGSVLGKAVESIIPKPKLSWYARGGVFSKASVIGVGESGKEAVVPLENNTEWITLIADGLIDRLLKNDFIDKLAAAFTDTPMPAMAGAVVPPNSLSRTDNSDLQAIRDTLADLRTLLSGRGEDSGTRDFRLYLDGREIYTTVKQYERQDRRSGGW